MLHARVTIHLQFDACKICKNGDKHVCNEYHYHNKYQLIKKEIVAYIQTSLISFTIINYNGCTKDNIMCG